MSEWKKVRIGDFLTESKIIAEESDAAHRITVRLNCKGVEQRSLKAEKKGATKYYTRRAGQFIYGKQNIHKGAFGIIPQELDGFTSSADLPAFDVDLSKCIPEWICICLQKDEYYKSLQKNVKGVGSQRLAVNVFLDSEIPLPSVEKQEEIIKKIKLQLQKAEQLAVELELQKNYIKQLRQNILQDAIEGKLTADWRKQNPVQKGNLDYDAEALFEQVQKERNKEKKQKGLSPITNEEKTFEIPKDWKWVRLGEITASTMAGKSFACQHRPAKNNELGIIKTSAITSGKFLQEENKYYSNNADLNNSTRIEIGDFLFCRASGSKGLAGRSCIVESINTTLLLSDKSIRVNLSPKVDKFYVNMLNNSFYGENYRLSLGTNKSTTMNNLTREQILNFVIPFPPLKEQEEIVNKVETLLAKVTTLENQIQTHKSLSDKLIFGIIKENLEGENE